MGIYKFLYYGGRFSREKPVPALKNAMSVSEILIIGYEFISPLAMLPRRKTYRSELHRKDLSFVRRNICRIVGRVDNEAGSRAARFFHIPDKRIINRNVLPLRRF